MFENMSDIILTQNIVSFYFLRLKIINVKYKNAKKKGKRFGHIWEPSSVP